MECSFKVLFIIISYQKAIISYLYIIRVTYIGTYDNTASRIFCAAFVCCCCSATRSSFQKISHQIFCKYISFNKGHSHACAPLIQPIWAVAKNSHFHFILSVVWPKMVIYRVTFGTSTWMPLAWQNVSRSLYRTHVASQGSLKRKMYCVVIGQYTLRAVFESRCISRHQLSVQCSPL